MKSSFIQISKRIRNAVRQNDREEIQAINKDIERMIDIGKLTEEEAASLQYSIRAIFYKR